MTLAVLFPGQGSQAVGMGQELAAELPAAREVFDAVDDALGEKLSELIWNGPADQLTLTANAQPALMAVSIAAIKGLASEGFVLADHGFCVAGHSLGEYSALCAAGSLSLSDTARLLRIRGRAMQNAVPPGKGAMAAIIGLEADAVEQICRDAVPQPSTDACCQIANDNGGGQLVISGSASHVQAASQLARERGAKRALPLPVSAPFHSALMAPAAEVMREALGKVEIIAPSVPVIMNVAAAPISDPDTIRACLVEQVSGQVRWRETVIWMADNGVTSAIEAGAGKILSGLVRRIAREINCAVVGSLAEAQKARAMWQ